MMHNLARGRLVKHVEVYFISACPETKQWSSGGRRECLEFAHQSFQTFMAPDKLNRSGISTLNTLRNHRTPNCGPRLGCCESLKLSTGHNEISLLSYHNLSSLTATQ